MVIVKFSDENFISFIEKKESKIKDINLGELLNSKPSYFKKKFIKTINLHIKNLKKDKKKEFEKLDKNLDYSILNDFFEKNLWKNPEIVDLLKCFALEEIFKKYNISKVLLDIKDIRIYLFLKNIISEDKITFKNNKKFIFYSTEKCKFIFFFFKSIFSFIKKTFLEIPLKEVKIHNKKSTNLFITYSTIFGNGELNDFFWKKLSLKDYRNSTKLIINADNSSNKNKIKLLKKMKKKDNFEFIESYQTVSIILKTIIKWIRLISIFYNFKSNKKNTAFLNLYLRRTILSYSSLKNINLICLLERYFEKKKFISVNYLFENLTWEKALNKILQHKKSVNAYQHTSVREWDFRYCPSQSEVSYLKNYLPRKIFANSLISKKELLKYFLKSKIYKTKKSRFSFDKNKLKNKKCFHNRILLIGDIDIEETKSITKLFLNNQNNTFKLDLKMHPINESKEINLNNLTIINSNDLKKIIGNYKYIICSNSTTSIYEVLKNKKIPFIYYNKDNLNLCPVKEMKNLNYISSEINVKNMILLKYNKKFNFKKFSRLYV